ncbi:MAG: FecR family protein [Actinomycetota bacterium]
MTVRAKRSVLIGSVLLSAGALIATYLILTAGPAQSRQFATFHLQEGTVEIQRAGEGGFNVAAEGQTLREGDVIRTGPDGRAEIEYFDGSITRLDFNTTFTIVALTEESEAGSTVIEADQASGGTFSRVVELTGSQSRFETSTPTAVASVRGTDYFVLINEDGTQIVGVIEGLVDVGGTVGDDVGLTALRGVDVSPSGVLGAPFDLPPELLNSDFLRWNLCERDFVASVCTEVEAKVQKPKKKEKPEEEAPDAVVLPLTPTYPPPAVAPNVIGAGQAGTGTAAGGAGAAPLAFTGFGLAMWLVIVAFLGLAGLALYAVGRRRGSASTDR